jgi:hypothetical protein
MRYFNVDFLGRQSHSERRAVSNQIGGYNQIQKLFHCVAHMFRAQGTTVYGSQHFYLGEFEDTVQKGSSSVEIFTTMRGLLKKKLEEKISCQFRFY